VLAVAGATVGVVFLVKHGAAQTRVEHAADTLNAVTDDPNSACSGPSPDLAGACADLHDALDDRHRDAVISAVGFASGGAFAAAFAVTLLAWPSNRDRSMAVSVSPTPGGAVLHGTF
jgi:hypothetical protein